MPELPEVQTVVNDLKRKIVGKKITDVWFDASKLIKSPKAGDLKKLIKNVKIEKIRRRAKNILIYLSGDKLLLIHQKMTGHLLVGRWKIKGKKVIPIEPPAIKEKVNNYIHLIFFLNNGRMLALSDLRKFAKVLLDKKEKIEKELKESGPEPLAKNFTFKKFEEIISKQKRPIKVVLMDFKIIAGIGNIYSDEILWKAGVHPLKSAGKLSQKELKDIYQAIKFIFKKALKLRGTSVADFRDTAGRAGKYGPVRYAYQRKNQPCFKCKTLIKKIKIGGRSAHYCPRCQSN